MVTFRIDSANVHRLKQEAKKLKITFSQHLRNLLNA